MLILNGGGIGQDAKEAYQALAENIGDKKNILYIPLAWKDETFKGCKEFVFNELKDYGNFEIYMLEDKSEFLNLDINSYGAMFIGGGNTYKLLKLLKESAGYDFISKFISTDKPILGGSAGAIIFGKDIRSSNICSSDINYWPDLDTSGFNMLGNKSIVCHFENTEEQNKNIEEYKNISEVITLRENETLIIESLKVKKLKSDEVYKVSHLYDEPDNPSFMEKRKEKIANGIQDIYVLENDKGIIGEVTIVYEDEHEGFTIKGKRVYMEALRIDKNMHNRGYGQYFINKVDEIIKAQGYTEITIGVEDDNLNARHIYNKLGFTEFIGREPGDKYAPEGYDVWMKILTPIIDKNGIVM